MAGCTTCSSRASRIAVQLLAGLANDLQLLPSTTVRMSIGEKPRPLDSRTFALGHQGQITALPRPLASKRTRLGAPLVRGLQDRQINTAQDTRHCTTGQHGNTTHIRPRRPCQYVAHEYTYLEASYEILKREHGPLHAKAIAERAKSEKLVKKTRNPRIKDAFSSYISTDIKKKW